MSSTSVKRAPLRAVRLGLARGWIEFWHSMTDRQYLVWTLMVNGIFLAVLIFQRGSTVEGTTFSLSMATLPSLLGMGVATSGYMGVAQQLAAEREDGTLLRVKAVPHGMIGYITARIVHTSLTAIFGQLLLLAAGLLLLDGLLTTGVSGWLTLLWVLALGLVATITWGTIVGSLLESPTAGVGMTFIPISLLVGISGIFYPITALPGWVQGLAQVFPVYWLGLGMRSALLPDTAAAIEIAGSWRSMETAGVLGLWALVGLVIAPPVLRRMARRESGSVMEARKQQALRRYT